jgi:hypothetical protein
MSLGELLARKGEQARAVFYHVRAQRQIANVTIERSVELFMMEEKIDMVEYEQIIRLYHRTAKDASDAGFTSDPCKKCPQA